MPICKECGFVASRLQWTHFKYNCTGRFKNGTEYKKAYPDSILVDPEVANKTAVTLDNLIRKYGIIDGKRRWEEYRSKQAISNTFEYKSKHHGWSMDEFSDFNKSRAVTYKNLMIKYGEERAIPKWKDYCDRQRYTNSVDYFIEKYGELDGIEKWKKYNKEKGKSHDVWWVASKYNVGLEEAEKIMSARYNPYVSNVEKTFIYNLIEIIGDVKYTFITKQFCIWSDELKSPQFYDATCSDRKKIIEFNGDYWHCNPSIYDENFLVKQRGMVARDIWRKDELKLRAAKMRGFDTLTIWESDYNSDAECIHDKIKTWWSTQ